MHHPERLKVLPLNVQGRDFIVGDLHGMHQALMQALAARDFSPEHGDRLLCTGDLVDRGDESLQTLRLLKAPWFHAVLGNHERILRAGMGHPERASMGHYAKVYSRWVQTLSAEDYAELQEDLLPRVAALPWVLRVGAHTPDMYQLVHAELRCGRRLTRDDELVGALDQADPSVLERLTWSRQLAVRALHRRWRQQGQSAADGVFETHRPWMAGIALTYVGHTVVPQPILHRSHLFLDRGACYATTPARQRRWTLWLHEHHPRARSLA